MDITEEALTEKESEMGKMFIDTEMSMDDKWADLESCMDEPCYRRECAFNFNGFCTTHDGCQYAFC